MPYKYIGSGKSHTRKFAGKNYYQQRKIHENKSEATAHAIDLRKQGYLARIVTIHVPGRKSRWTRIYRVYARRKK